MNTPSIGAEIPRFTRYQKFVVAMLTFLQFTVILDFMILAPLGAILMPALKLSPSQFGLVVSAYAFSAGLSGVLASGFADHFDRKKFLIFFYIGFLVGTGLCALADTYEFLLAARIITGLFGGVIGSVVMAIITDLFKPNMRGRVMGFVQAAFAASQILGLPIGLFLANHGGWQSAFVMIVLVSLVAFVVIAIFLKPIDEHLKIEDKRNAFGHLWATIANFRHLQAFAAVVLMATGGFMLMPFGSAFSVHNLMIDINDLPIVYLVTGIGAMIAGPFVGRAADSMGRFLVFAVSSIVTIVMVTIWTHLGVTPLWTLSLVNVVLFVGISGRIIASQTMMSLIPRPENRGSFMSVSSSIQQVSGGFAAMLAGLIVVEEPSGRLQHVDILGYVVTLATLCTMVMMYRLDKLTRATANASPS